MNLLQFVRTVYPLNREVSPNCLRNYAKHVRDLERFSQRRLAASDLEPQLVSSWLIDKLHQGCSPHYVSALRSSVIAVWTLANELGECGNRPRVTRIKRPELLIRVWSARDVAELASEASRLKGTIARKLPRGEYVATAIMAAWYTGLRRNDIHRIRRDSIQEDGSFVVIQNKSGKRKACWIPPEMINRVDEWCHSTGPIWPRPGTDEVMRRIFAGIVSRVASRRERAFYRGVWKDIRRSAEHSAEKLHPGKGHEHAGHERRTYETFYKATTTRPDVLPSILPPIE